jgi:hypothetical protein
LLYKDVNDTFQNNYAQYKAICGSGIPGWLAPVENNLPSLYAFLQFVYGWVPFQSLGCPLTELPVGMIPREYIRLEDNFQEVRGLSPAEGQQIFNPYAQLVHAAPNGTPPVPYGLDAATYAYSIDDQSSFLSQPGVGLIFAVGGKNGLPNPHKHIFPPPLDPEHDIQVILAGGSNIGLPAWSMYAICADPSAPPNIAFPNPPTEPNGGQRFSVPTDNPKFWHLPCYLTISDTANRVYQIEILKRLPWPVFNNEPPFQPKFDHTVMTCPTPNIKGYKSVPADPNNPNTWCGGTLEVSNPIGTPTNAQRFELDTRAPNPIP